MAWEEFPVGSRLTLLLHSLVLMAWAVGTGTENWGSPLLPTPPLLPGRQPGSRSWAGT